MVRPTSKQRTKINTAIQQAAHEQLVEKIKEAGTNVQSTIHDDIIVPAKVGTKEWERLAKIFTNDDTITRAQEKDREHKAFVRSSLVIGPEPQFVHTICGNKSVVVRLRKVTWTRDERELFCTHCKVVPHELHVEGLLT